jgi:hypothetical protein
MILSLTNHFPFVIPFRQLAEGHGIHVELTTDVDSGSLAGMTTKVRGLIGDSMRTFIFKWKKNSVFGYDKSL